MKEEKGRLRHELDEKTLEAQEYCFIIETRDQQLALEKGEKDRLQREVNEKTLEYQSDAGFALDQSLDLSPCKIVVPTPLAIVLSSRLTSNRFIHATRSKKRLS